MTHNIHTCPTHGSPATASLSLHSFSIAHVTHLLFQVVDDGCEDVDATRYPDECHYRHAHCLLRKRHWPLAARTQQAQASLAQRAGWHSARPISKFRKFQVPSSNKVLTQPAMAPLTLLACAAAACGCSAASASMAPARTVSDTFTTYNTSVWDYADGTLGTTDGCKVCPHAPSLPSVPCIVPGHAWLQDPLITDAKTAAARTMTESAHCCVYSCRSDS